MRVSSRLRRVGFHLAAISIASVLAVAASAHVVYQRKTLREWAQQADVVVVAEVLSPLQVWSAPDGSDHQEFFSLRVVRHLAGGPIEQSVDVFPHAEGEPRYRPGDRALLFLDRTAARAEFARLAERFPFFTTQGAGHEWKLDAAGDDELVEIAGAWRGLGAGATYAERRPLLLRELASTHSQLRAEAIADLTRLRAAVAADPDTVAQLTTASRSDRLPVNEKIALIRLLEDAPGFDAGDAMLRLAGECRDTGDLAGRVAVVRAAGALRGDAITSWLVEQLAAPDADTREAGLIALANPWHAAAVRAIAGHTGSDEDPRVAAAAVRALGAIGNEEATAFLRDVAGREQPPVSNLAAAQLQRLQRRQQSIE